MFTIAAYWQYFAKQIFEINAFCYHFHDNQQKSKLKINLKS